MLILANYVFLVQNFMLIPKKLGVIFLDHNLRVLNVNLSYNVLYLETFTYELAKHKMATKMLRKRHIS